MTNTINTRVTENQNNKLHNNLEECRYVDCSEFESSYNKFVGISALHLNISSLSKHIDSLGNMLEQLALDFNVIAISETRITQDAIPHNLEIPNYECVFDQDRSSGRWNSHLHSQKLNVQNTP